MPDAKAVQSMFAGIAPRYDAANRWLSGGVDLYWRRCLVGAARRALQQQVAAGLAPTEGPWPVADLATGTGDVAFALQRGLGARASVAGLDFCQPMLDVAMARQPRQRLPRVVPFAQGDILQLPLPDASQQVLTIAFGLRNLADRAKGLAEMRRVLRPGGTLLVLEFTQPDRWFSPLYYAYLRWLLIPLGGWITGQPAAYSYLVGSVASFPPREQISAELTAAGFAPVAARGLTFGIVALHTALRPT